MVRSKKSSKVIDLSGASKEATDKFEIKNYDYGVEQNNEDLQFEKDLDYLLNDQLTTEASSKMLVKEGEEFSYETVNVSTDIGSKKKSKKRSKKINIDAITKDINDIVFSSNDEGSDTELIEEVKGKVKAINEVLEKQHVTSKKSKNSRSKKAPSKEADKDQENGDLENKKSENKENDAEYSETCNDMIPETNKNRKRDAKKKRKPLQKKELSPTLQNELISKASNKSKQKSKEEERNLWGEVEKSKAKKKNKSPRDKKETPVDQPDSEKVDQITIEQQSKQQTEDNQKDIEESTEDPLNTATAAKRSKKRTKKKSKSAITLDVTVFLKEELKGEEIEPQNRAEESKKKEKKKKDSKKKKQMKKDKEDASDEVSNKASEKAVDKDSISEVESENKYESTSESEDLMEPNGTFKLLGNLPDSEEKNDSNSSEPSEGKVNSPGPSYSKNVNKANMSNDNLNSENEFLGIKLKPIKHSGSSKFTDSLQPSPSIKTIIGLSKEQILKLNLSDVKIKTIVSSTSKSKYTSILLNFVLKHSHDLFENLIEKEMFISLCINVALYESQGFKKYTDSNPKVVEIVDRFDEFKLENTRSKYTPSTKNAHKNDYDYTILSFIGHVILWAVHLNDSNNSPLICKLSDLNISNDQIYKSIGGNYLWDKLKRHNTINSKRWKHIIKFRQHFTLDEDQFVLIIRMMKVGQ